MYISPDLIMHNCQLCKKEWLGRCFGNHYGQDVSMNNEPCAGYEFGGTAERLQEIKNRENTLCKRLEELEKMVSNQ